MPKKKTKKAAAKRFKKTSGGKIKYYKAGSGHLMASKSRKRKRVLRKEQVLSKHQAVRVAEMI